MFRVSGMEDAKPLVRECKYVSGRVGADASARLVAAFAEADPAHPAGELESVYYDTPALDAWREKANGDVFKRKVRVRWYRGGGGAVRRVFLEVKDRIGAARDKARFSFEWDAAFLDGAPLTDPGFAELLRAGTAAAGFDLPVAALVPTVSIRYARRRFVCPATGSRVSVDSSILCPRANEALFPFAGPAECPLVVVEAKSATVREWPFGPALVRAGFRLRSFSKYGFFLEHQLAGAFR